MAVTVRKHFEQLQGEFRRWYASISIRDLALNAGLAREIEDLERKLSELIYELA